MAPEVLKGKYTKQADLWSIGVIAYMLMSSQMPFYGRKQSHIIEQIMKGYVPVFCMLWWIHVLNAQLDPTRQCCISHTHSCWFNVVYAIRRQYEFKGRRWKRISKQGRAFVEDLLVVDPNDRATSDEAMKAIWLNRRFGATVRDPCSEELESVQNSMVKFADYSKLRKLALMGTLSLIRIGMYCSDDCLSPRPSSSGCP